MKRQDIEACVPVALRELHDAGFERVYFDQLGQQITSHDIAFLERRKRIKSVIDSVGATKILKVVGIDLSAPPSGHLHPGPAKLYPALRNLETAGVVAGEFDPPVEGVEYPRRAYYLVKPTENVDPL